MLPHVVVAEVQSRCLATGFPVPVPVPAPRRRGLRVGLIIGIVVAALLAVSVAVHLAVAHSTRGGVTLPGTLLGLRKNTSPQPLALDHDLSRAGSVAAGT